MAAVLAGDTGDECAFHVALPIMIGLSRSGALEASRPGGPIPGPAGRGTRRSGGLRRPRRSPRRRPAGPRAPAGSRGWSRGASGRSPSPRQPDCRRRSRPRWYADAEVRVRLHVVARELSQARPRVEEARPAGAHVGDRVAAALDRTRERGAQRVDRVVGLGLEHRLGNPAWSEADLGHEPVMLMSPRHDVGMGACVGRRGFGQPGTDARPARMGPPVGSRHGATGDGSRPRPSPPATGAEPKSRSRRHRPGSSSCGTP